MVSTSRILHAATQQNDKEWDEALDQWKTSLTFASLSDNLLETASFSGVAIDAMTQWRTSAVMIGDAHHQTALPNSFMYTWFNQAVINRTSCAATSPGRSLIADSSAAHGVVNARHYRGWFPSTGRLSSQLLLLPGDYGTGLLRL